MLKDVANRLQVLFGTTRLYRPPPRRSRWSSSSVVSFSTDATPAAAVGAGPSADEDELYARAKPFSSIPGPSGLPYIGTLMQYRIGMVWTTSSKFFFQFNILATEDKNITMKTIFSL